MCFAFIGPRQPQLEALALLWLTAE